MMSHISINQSTHNLRPKLLTLIGLFLVANLATPSLLENSRQGTLGGIFFCLFFSVLISEVVLLAIWAVFGTDEITQRFGRVLLVLALGWLAFMVGVRIPRMNPVPWQVGLGFAIFALLLFVLVTGSVYAYRSLTGQVLRFRDDLRQLPVRVFQFSIKQVLGWTTGVALALMVVRLLFNTDDGGAPRFWREFVDMIGTALLFAVLITILTATCLELVLGRGSKIKWIGVLAAAVTIASILATAVQLLFGRVTRPGELVEQLETTFAFFTGLSMTTSFVLTLVGWSGFRLVRLTDISSAATNQEST